jgi:hypothetical protein
LACSAACSHLRRCTLSLSIHERSLLVMVKSADQQAVSMTNALLRLPPGVQARRLPDQCPPGTLRDALIEMMYVHSLPRWPCAWRLAIYEAVAEAFAQCAPAARASTAPTAGLCAL